MISKILIILLCLTLVSCYTRQKAQTQFSKAAVNYPEIPAGYCARTYPPRDSIIKGDTIITYDTLWGEGMTHFDTVYSFRKDTVFITRVVPGKTILQTIHVSDTIFKENTAALDLCSIERGKAITLAMDKTKEADKWRRIAKKRFLIILGMGAGIALGIFAVIRRKIVKKI